MLAYTTFYIHLHLSDLAGLRPSNPPHTRGEPLVNPPKRPCGAEDSAVKEKNNFRIRSSREQAFDNLYFSPFLRG